MEPISLLDYVLLPLTIGLVYFSAFRIRNKYYPRKHPWRKYFIAGLSIKIFGAVFNGMLHYYYYGGGDTFNFFFHSRIIDSALDESFLKWINLLFRVPDYYSVDYYKYTSQMYWYDDTSSYTVGAIGAVFGLFTFSSYLPTAVLFAFVSYSGVWAMFRTFASLYPALTRQIAIVTLFIPTTVLWGSGIYKDTVCMFGLGWLTFCVFRFLVQRDFSLKNILLACLSFWLIGKVKVYILIAFMPALGMWILFNYTKKIRNKLSRRAVGLAAVAVLVIAFVAVMTSFSKELGTYSLDRLADKAEETRGWIYQSSQDQEGSSYTLGDDNPKTISEMLAKFPQAVNVTLFRPYFWEARKVIMIFSAIESFLFLVLTFKVLFGVGPAVFWRTIQEDPTIQFCLVFSIIFAFAVGVTTYNFGSLSRYKIPCLPFYALAFVLIYYKNKPPNQKLLFL